MPRLVHEPVPGIVQHVISRFVDGKHLLEDEQTRVQYLVQLGLALKDCEWKLLWYALMETHVHLALAAGNAPLKSWLQPAHTGFAVRLNLRGRHAETGIEAGGGNYRRSGLPDARQKPGSTYRERAPDRGAGLEGARASYGRDCGVTGHRRPRCNPSCETKLLERR